MPGTRALGVLLSVAVDGHNRLRAQCRSDRRFLSRQDHPHVHRLRAGRRLRSLWPAGRRISAQSISPAPPRSLPQNMPGGGSFVAARYMAEVAPKDGTVLGSLAQTLALDSAINSSAKLDAAKFRYVGRVTTNIDVGAALPAVGIKSFDDVRKRPVHGRRVRRRLDHGPVPVGAQCLWRRQVQDRAGIQRNQRYPAGHGARRGGHRRRLRIAWHARQSSRMDRQRRGDDHLSGRARAPPAAAEHADAARARGRR